MFISGILVTGVYCTYQGIKGVDNETNMLPFFIIGRNCFSVLIHCDNTAAFTILCTTNRVLCSRLYLFIYIYLLDCICIHTINSRYMHTPLLFIIVLNTYFGTRFKLKVKSQLCNVIELCARKGHFLCRYNRIVKHSQDI